MKNPWVAPVILGSLLLLGTGFAVFTQSSLSPAFDSEAGDEGGEAVQNQMDGDDAADPPSITSRPAQRQRSGLQAADLKLSGPYAYRNLTVFLIHGKDQLPGRSFLTLQEALERGKAVVHETGTVGRLTVENKSRADLFVQAGDIVKGGQQDRVIPYDYLVPAGSAGVPLASFCV
jgi:hypothetical protein